MTKNTDTDIDIDNSTLYDYVNELDRTRKFDMINDMAEPFNGDNKENKKSEDAPLFSNNFLIFVGIAIILIVIGFMFTKSGPCENIESQMNFKRESDYTDLYSSLFNKNMFNSSSSMMPVFVRN